RVRVRSPTCCGRCLQFGSALTKVPVPTAPAAHYACGGVRTDLHARSSITRLYAAGEVACTGLHGANRLASNSLLEGLVFGARAAQAMTEPARAAATKSNRRYAIVPPPSDTADSAPSVDDIRALMWKSAGLFRAAEGLADAVRVMDRAASAVFPSSPDGRQHRNLTTVARLIARAALRRDESRGGHYRTDFPARDDVNWEIHLVDSQ